jgi:hypothetical protein
MDVACGAGVADPAAEQIRTQAQQMDQPGEAAQAADGEQVQAQDQTSDGEAAQTADGEQVQAQDQTSDGEAAQTADGDGSGVPSEDAVLARQQQCLESVARCAQAAAESGSQTIADQGLDPHIVVISCLPGDCDGHSQNHGICIDAPLGIGRCPDVDTNLPAYLHIDTRMPSRKLLERAVDTHQQWQPMLRPTALTHVVAISDDGEEQSAEQFRQALANLNPPLTDFVFHGIYSMLGKEDACAISSSEPCWIRS